MLGIHGGFPQLVIVHLTQTLVALDATFLGKPAICSGSRGKHVVAFLV